MAHYTRGVLRGGRHAGGPGGRRVPPADGRPPADTPLPNQGGGGVLRTRQPDIGPLERALLPRLQASTPSMAADRDGWWRAGAFAWPTSRLRPSRGAPAWLRRGVSPKRPGPIRPSGLADVVRPTQEAPGST